MRISDAKNLHHSDRWKHIIGILWDSDAMHKCIYDANVSSAAELLALLVQCYTSSTSWSVTKEKDIKSNFRKLSDLLYGNRYTWAIGTPYEEHERAIYAETMVTKSRKRDLEFLYDMLELDRKRGAGIVHQMARDDAVYRLLIKAHNAGTLTAERVYEIAYDYYSKDVTEGKFFLAYYNILCACSMWCYGTPHVWVKERGLDINTIRAIVKLKPLKYK